MLKFLNKKQSKEIIDKLKQQYNIKDLKLDYIFMINNDNKIYITNKDIAKLDTSNLRIDSIGLYFAAIDNSKRIRLTIEGSQLIGKKANINILELTKKQATEWIKGLDISTDKELKGYVIIKYKSYFLGSGFYSDNTIKNFVSKSRRLQEISSNF